MDPELQKRRPVVSESKWQIETREVLHKNPWYQYVHDSGITDSGKPFDYYYRDISNYSVAAIALTQKQELILVRQYRYLTNRESLEIPGGISLGKKTAKQLVIDELREETGYEGAHVLELGEIDVSNGSSNDIAKVFLFSGCKQVGEQQLEDTEEGMTVELYPAEQVFELVQEGKITDGVTLAALLLAWPHLL